MRKKCVIRSFALPISIHYGITHSSFCSLHRYNRHDYFHCCLYMCFRMITHFGTHQKNPVPPRSVPAGQAISDPSAELVLPRSSDDIKCERHHSLRHYKTYKTQIFHCFAKEAPNSSNNFAPQMWC